MTKVNVVANREFRLKFFYGSENVMVFFRTWSIAVIIWWLLAIYTNNSLIIPTPTSVFNSLVDLILSGEIIIDMFTSIGRLLIGFAIALVVGVILGFGIGLSPFVRDLMELPLEMFRPISGIAWIPLALLLFGIGDALPIFIAFYGCIFPILLSTVVGVRTVDTTLLRASHSMCIPKKHIIFQVIIPAAVPLIITGARTALGFGWISLVAGEMFGSTKGLGYALQNYQQLIQTSNIFAVIAVIGALGFLMDYGLRMFQSWFSPWETRISEV